MEQDRAKTARHESMEIAPGPKFPEGATVVMCVTCGRLARECACPAPEAQGERAVGTDDLARAHEWASNLADDEYQDRTLILEGLLEMLADVTAGTRIDFPWYNRMYTR
jgi:hypothetical protein